MEAWLLSLLKGDLISSSPDLSLAHSAGTHVGRQGFAVGGTAHLLNLLLGRHLAHETGPDRCAHLTQPWKSEVVCKFIFPYETNCSTVSFGLSLLA